MSRFPRTDCDRVGGSRIALPPEARQRVGPREAHMSQPESTATLVPAEKVKQFPTTPGLYLMKDAQGRVIYVGKAKNLRARAGSYFHKTAAHDRRICDWIEEVADLDHLV